MSTIQDRRCLIVTSIDSFVAMIVYMHVIKYEGVGDGLCE